jgi:hypothetical protein
MRTLKAKAAKTHKKRNIRNLFLINKIPVSSIIISVGDTWIGGNKIYK